MKDSWEVKKLEDVCEIATGRKDVNEGNPDGEYPFFTCAKAHTFSDTFSFDTEALLIAGNGDVGNVNYYNGKFEAYQRTYVLFDFKRIQPRYLFIVLDGTLKQVMAQKKLGNTMPYIKLGMLKEFEIPLPPLPEQKRIVAILDEAFEAIAKAKENTEQNIKNAKEIFESYLQGVFDGSASSPTNKGDALSSSKCDALSLSKWEEKKLGEVTDIVNGGTPKTNIKEYWDGDIHWITPADLGKLKTSIVGETSRKISSLGLQKSSAKLFPENSVILSTRAPIGHLAINKVVMSTNQGCRGIVPKKMLDTWYLYYFLKKNVQLLNELGTGTTFKELSKGALSNIVIPFPSIEEQQTIVHQLDALRAETQKLEAIYTQKLNDLEELKKSLLQKAFAGELVK